MEIISCVCVLALLVSVLPEDRRTENFPGVRAEGNEDILVLNEFMDSIIREIRLSPHLTELFRPLKLERNITFSRGVIYDISVDGLLSLHRQGDITFVPDAPVVTAKLAVNDIDLDFKYRMRTLGGVSSKGRLRMNVNNIAMDLKASLRGMEVRLDHFEIDYFGKIRVRDFAGVSPMLNWLVRPTLELVLNASRTKLKRKIENELREKLEDEFRRVHLEDVLASLIQR